MRVIASIAGSLLGATTFWLMWPAPFEPAIWIEPEPPELTGALRENNALADAQTVMLGAEIAGEGLAVDQEGRVYFGTRDGRVGRLVPGDEHDAWLIEDLAKISDAPIMGLQWIDEHTLGLAANAGLLALDTQNLVVTSLSTGSPVRPFGFVNDLATAPDNTVYFTDSSTRWGHSSDSPGYLYDMLENRPHGMLYAWDPVTRQTEVIADRLYYPNGIVVMPDGQSVLVSETFRYAIQRIWINGPRRGEIEVFADNLPGMPDGMQLDADGRLYIAMLGQRSGLLRAVRAQPIWTKLIVKLPGWLRPDGGRTTGFVLVMDVETRTVLDTYHDGDGALNYVSSVALDPDGRLWFGSTYGAYAARLDLRQRADIADTEKSR